MVNSRLLHELKLLGEDYRNGDEIIKMLDHYGVNGLRELTEDQVKDYYDSRVIETFFKKEEGK